MQKLVLSLFLLCLVTTGARADDPRQLVALPAMMQDHMLANMREHLAALDDILRALAANDRKTAANVAEERLGMSSLAAHGAAHMAPFMPAEMQALGSSLHQAASRFAVAAIDSELDPEKVAQEKVYGALHEVTAACRGCHEQFRIR